MLKVATHAGIETLGGLGVGCVLLLCSHDHFHGRFAFVNRLVHSRAYRATVIGAFYLLTSVATVFALDSEVLREGLAVAALAVLLHLVLEAAGGAGLMAFAGVDRSRFWLGGGDTCRSGAGEPIGRRWRTRAAQTALLGAWYLAFALLAVTLIPFGHGG